MVLNLGGLSNLRAINLVWLFFLASSVGWAESKTPTHPIAPSQMTCEEFIALDEITRPKVVYWADGFNRKEKTGSEVVNFVETDRMVPVLVKECEKRPKELFWKVIKMKPFMPFG